MRNTLKVALSLPDPALHFHSNPAPHSWAAEPKRGIRKVRGSGKAEVEHRDAGPGVREPAERARGEQQMAGWPCPCHKLRIVPAVGAGPHHGESPWLFATFSHPRSSSPAHSP
ncbi:hypothetical protein GCM10018779_31700 [Streptomyces griseocarneus]|nr:hypothetical protein GCM10018779_31700 [Streptomyces griseocarneus]